MKRNSSVEEILSALDAAQRILIVSHMSPDPDAYGSSLGLMYLLKTRSKESVCINVDGPSDRYLCIPGINSVSSKIPEVDWELVVACDSATAPRLGDDFYQEVLGAAPKLINIDHHVSNSRYGNLDYVIETASSTSEIIADLAISANWDISKEAAMALLAGIYGDTGAFRYSSTTAKTFGIARTLISAGAIPSEIADDLYGNKRLSAVKIQAQALLNVELLNDGKVATSILTAENFKEVGAVHEDTETLVESIRDIQGVKVAALVYWFVDCWKVSLRSKSKRLNVSDVASGFGGGGHIQAAAFSWRKSLDELLQALLPKLEQLTKES